MRRSATRISIARNPAQFAQLTKALAVAQEDLAGAEEQWLTLEMLREELEC